jgi:chromosome segregation ATPase
VQEGLIGKEDDYSITEEKIKELVTFLEGKTGERNVEELKLEEITKKRTDLFMSLFKPVSANIDEVYKKLT